jgi:hypothetical protein
LLEASDNRATLTRRKIRAEIQRPKGGHSGLQRERPADTPGELGNRRGCRLGHGVVLAARPRLGKDLVPHPWKRCARAHRSDTSRCDYLGSVLIHSRTTQAMACPIEAGSNSRSTPARASALSTSGLARRGGPALGERLHAGMMQKRRPRSVRGASASARRLRPTILQLHQLASE